MLDRCVELVRAVKDRLVAEHKYGDEEDMALVEIMEFFSCRRLNKDLVLTFSFLATSNIAEIGFSSQGYGYDMTTMKVVNRNVVEALQKWHLGWHQGLLSFDNFIFGKHFGFETV
ncbi:unnamed protein product [Lactuca saligna]|uniref:Uncharacterized protein n=1 Tax=Lactuca saligna TaxID=75948 RepID=A0AA36EDL1_LACSI|nr:unnamed protein product [Lactuca saligna]